MTDDEAKVLEAFAKKSSMCLHVLRDETLLDYKELRPVVLGLIQKRLIRAKMGAHSGDRIYELADLESVSELVAELPIAFRLSEETVKSRVHMIRRMKASLIEQWHPVLNVMLRDYESGLKSADNLRFPPDHDETRS